MRTPPSLPPTYGSATRVLRLYLHIEREGAEATPTTAAAYLGCSVKSIERYAKAIESVTGKPVFAARAPWDWEKYRLKDMPRGINPTRKPRRCVECLEYTTTTTKVNGETVPCCAACLKRYT